MGLENNVIHQDNMMMIVDAGLIIIIIITFA